MGGIWTHGLIFGSSNPLNNHGHNVVTHYGFIDIQWSKKCAKNSINYFLHLLHNSSHSEITFIWIFFTLWESIIFSPPRPLCTVIMIYTIVGSIPFVTFWHHFHLFSMKQKMCKKHAKNSISYFLHPRPLCTVITVYTVVVSVQFVEFWHLIINREIFLNPKFLNC